MWWRNGIPEQDQLNAYWDAVVSGASSEAPGQHPGLDPNYREAIAQVRALHRRHRPDPAFALHLETTLMNAFATTYPKSTVLQPAQPKRLVTRPTWLPRREVYLPRRWSLAAVATLALIAITIAIFFFNLRDTNQPAILPGTPDAATPTAVPATDEPASMYRGGPGRTGVLPGPGVIGAPVELWKLQTGEPVNLGAAVVDGVLYVPAGSQGFEAREAMTGDLLWAFPTDAAAVSAPAVVDGFGYVIDAEGTLYAVRTGDGSEAWRMANINVRSSVAPVDGLVYAVSPEGTLYALDAATGAITWQAETGAEAAGGMAVVDGLVYQGNAAGVMSAFDARTGELRWTFQNEEGRGNATVTVANGQIYITISGGDTNAMYAVNATSGELTWRQEQGPGQGFISTTATPTRLYSVAENGLLHGLDAGTGETVWTYQLVEFVRSIPVLVDDTLYVADNGGFVRAIDPHNGTPLWQYSIAGEVDLGWPVVSNGVLYIGTSFGNFYAITGSDMIPAPSVLTPAPAATPVAASDSATTASPPAGTTGVARIVWESDDAIAELSHALGVAIAPDGTIWVADGANSRFQIFDPDGTLLEVWGEKGAGEGQFNFVRTSNGDGMGGVAFAADGSFYVADTGNYRIQHFSADGEFLAAWGSFGTENGQFVSPSSIGVDSQGNVIVSDDLREDIQKFDASGAWLATIGRSGSGPGELDYQGFLTIGLDDTIWIADPENQRIHHFANDGALIADLDFASIPDVPVWVQSLTVDAHGRLYLADIDGKRLFVLGSDGTVLGIWSLLRADGSPNPNSGELEVAADGTVYLTDWLNGTLYRYELDPPVDQAAVVASPVAVTEQVTLLWQTTGGPTPLDRTFNPRIAPDGNIWVPDGGHSQFQIFSPDGTFIEAWGTPGSGDGEFNFTRPNSNGDSFGAVAFAPDGSFYVADTGNHRIQHFAADRTFLHAWGSFGGEDGQFSSPVDLAVDADGLVYVGDDRREDLQVFTADGTFVRVFGGGGDPEFQGWITLGPDDTIWGADGGRYLLHQWQSDGTLLRTIEVALSNGTPVIVGDVAFDAAGNMLVPDGDNGRLLLLDPDGVLLEEWEVAHVGGMTPDGTGAYYTTDYGAGLLVKYQIPQPAAETSESATADAAELLWETTGGEGGFGIPSSVTLAPDGTIWVADVGTHQFQIFDADGTFIESWKATGDGEFTFLRPNGDRFNALAFMADGSFYVLDPGKYRIQAFAPDRTFVRSIGAFGGEAGQFLSPIDVTIDPAGNLAVMDEARGDVQTFAPDGTLVATIPLQSTVTGAPNMNSMIIDTEGNFYLAELTEDWQKLRIVEKFDPAGNLVQQFGLEPGPGKLVDHPLNIAVDAAGNVYVTESEANPRIIKFSPDGEYLTEIRDPATPGDIALDDQGNIYVTDGSQGTLVKLRLPQSLSSAVSPVASPVAVADRVTVLWETTGGDGGFDNPSTLTIAPDGTIWVADAGNARFQIFDADGTFLESWTGTGDGQFSLVDNNGDQLGAVSFAPDGSLYVLDPGARQVLVFSADRTFVRSIGEPGKGPGQFFQPYAIVTDQAGNVAVLDDARGDIQIFAPDGTLVATILPQSTYDVPLSVNLMTVDGDGNIYIVEAYYDEPTLAPVVGKYDPEGNLLQQFGDASGPGSFGRTQGGEFNDQPLGVTVDASGNVYVTEIGTNPRIVVFSAEGDFLMEFGGAGSSTVAFDFPFDVAADGQGNIFVTDMFQNRLVKLRLPQSLAPAASGDDASPESEGPSASDAELLWQTTGGPTALSRTSTAEIAPDGNVWVADGAHSQFQIFSPDGTFIESWGTPGSGDGEFNFVRPNSEGDSFGAVAFAPDGTFYVADMGNWRVQHFAADRTFLHAWGSLGAEDGQFVSPIDIAVDSQGNVFVDDDKREDIQKFAADGAFLLKFGGPGSAPGQLDFQGWMTIDGEDNVWVADSANGRVQQWASDGTFLREVRLDGIVGDPSNVAFDAAGLLYVLDNSDKRVVVFDSAYAVIGSWDLTTSSGTPPETVIGMALDDDGGLYVTDYLGSMLIKYQLGAIPNGTPVAP